MHPLRASEAASQGLVRIRVVFEGRRLSKKDLRELRKEELVEGSMMEEAVSIWEIVAFYEALIEVDRPSSCRK